MFLSILWFVMQVAIAITAITSCAVITIALIVMFAEGLQDKKEIANDDP